MAFALGLYEAGSQILNLDAGAYTVLDYKKEIPRRTSEGTYDLYTKLEETVVMQVAASSRAGLDDAINQIEMRLGEAERYERVLEIGHTPDQGTLKVYARLWGGYIERDDSFTRVNTAGNWTEQISLHWMRQPDWEAAEIQVTLTTDLGDNGANNFMVLPALLGQLPARCRLRVTGTGGNIANAKMVGAAVRTQHTPSSFTHLINASTYAARDASVTTLADGNALGGSVQKFVPTNTNQISLLRFSFAGATALALEGAHLVCVKYRDRAGAPNFLLQARAGIELSGSQAWGTYGASPLKTVTVDAANNAEMGWLDVGIINIPRANGIVIELLGQALTVASELHINYLALYPFGDPLPGKGAQVTTYPFGIGSNRAYLQSYVAEKSAWLANGADTVLAEGIGFPDGGDILLPAGAAGNRIYVWLCKDRAGGLRHDHTISLDATLFYRPRFVSADGGV